jgi:hypothetical protein
VRLSGPRIDPAAEHVVNMTASIPVAIALAVLAGCAHKPKEEPSAAAPQGKTQAAAQQTAAPATIPPPPVDQGWPRTHDSGTTTTKIFQPQLESWDGFTLKANAAVEVDLVGAEAVFGLAHMTARTTVDYGAHMVKLDDVKVTSAQFPSAPRPGRGPWRLRSPW